MFLAYSLILLRIVYFLSAHPQAEEGIGYARLVDEALVVLTLLK